MRLLIISSAVINSDSGNICGSIANNQNRPDCACLWWAKGLSHYNVSQAVPGADNHYNAHFSFS